MVVWCRWLKSKVSPLSLTSNLSKFIYSYTKPQASNTSSMILELLCKVCQYKFNALIISSSHKIWRSID